MLNCLVEEVLLPDVHRSHLPNDAHLVSSPADSFAKMRGCKQGEDVGAENVGGDTDRKMDMNDVGLVDDVPGDTKGTERKKMMKGGQRDSKERMMSTKNRTLPSEIFWVNRFVCVAVQLTRIDNRRLSQFIQIDSRTSNKRGYLSLTGLRKRERYTCPAVD